MHFREALLAAALVAMAAAPAHAQVNIYYHAGGWDAFDGQGDNGQPICGIGSRNPADGRTFSLRFQIGGNAVTFIAAKPGWHIPNGTQIPAVMQVGLERPWPVQAVGNGDRVQWTMDRGDIATFDAEFRRASSMTVTFPDGNEQPWIISLAGSTAVSNAMGRCVTDLTRRAAAGAPQAAATAPAAQSTTQPFTAAPTAQDSAAPAQSGQNNSPPAQNNAAPDQPINQGQAPQEQSAQPSQAPGPTH